MPTNRSWMGYSPCFIQRTFAIKSEYNPIFYANILLHYRCICMQNGVRIAREHSKISGLQKPQTSYEF